MTLSMKKRLKAAAFGVFLGLIAIPTLADEACENEILAITDAIADPAPGVSAGDIEQAQILLDMVDERCASGDTLESVENDVGAIKKMLRME